MLILLMIFCGLVNLTAFRSILESWSLGVVSHAFNPRFWGQSHLCEFEAARYI